MSKEQRSLFGEILDWMLAPLLLVWPLSVALTWLIAQNIANNPFDRQIGEVALVLSRKVVLPSPQQAVFELPASASEILHTDASDEVYFQVLGLKGELLGGDAQLPPPPANEELAPSGEVRWRDDMREDMAIRVAYVWVDNLRGQPRVLVQVAETLRKRSRLAAEIIKGVMLPQFVILPLAVLLVWLALVRGIAPLNQLQQRIRQRQSSDLSPIDERGAPEEVSPLVEAINDLLQRLDQSILTQKHFLADAAHQLKTPLAGLRTQAELAQRELEAGDLDLQAVRRSLRQIARSSQNAAHTVNQLLSMARTENREIRQRHVPVNMTKLAVEAVHDFFPKAMEKRIDLGYDGPTPRETALAVVGQPVLLRELINNLVDNALNYTPEGGTVTVRVMNDPFGQVVVLQVEDSGPGIAPTEREKVFAPFYRSLGTNVDGSGLGLAIVREIADQHDAEILLEDVNARHRPGLNEQGGVLFGPGAKFTVRFHATAAAPGPFDGTTLGDGPSGDTGR